jgi:hypothetical protein
MKLKLFLFVLITVCLSTKLLAQNFNVNLLPVRLVRNNQNKPDFLIGFKYFEVERKLSDNYSISLGVYYTRDKEELLLSSYKHLYYNLDPSLRYYLGKNKNMNGFYFGLGFNYLRDSYYSSGRFASLDGSIVNRTLVNEIINFNFNAGYKLVLINNRFSIDFKANQLINLISKETTTTNNSNGQIVKNSSNLNQNLVYFPFLDLKLGYRFGFKK